MTRQRKRATVVATTVAAIVAVALPAWAFYAFSTSSSTANVTASSLGSPVTGTPSATSASVSFSVSAPASGPTPSGYRVDRTAPSAASNVCPSLSSGPGTCTDASPVAGQTNTYSVYALIGASWASLSPTPVSVSVPAPAPTVAITFPSASAYNAAGWTAGCGTAATDDICGTSANAASVSVSVRQGTGNYWSGTAFNSASEVMLSATGTSTWSLGFAGSRFTNGTSYTIRAVAGTASASKTFTWDTTVPTAQNAVSADVAGTAGKIEATDTLTLTYSEAVDPNTIVSGWTGTSMNIVVRGGDNASAGGKDLLTIFNSANTTQLPIGTVDLGETGFFTGNVTYGATGTAATMSLSSGTLTITLGTVSDSTKLGTLSASNQKSRLTWTPTATVKDIAGNACSTTTFVGGNATQF